MAVRLLAGFYNSSEPRLVFQDERASLVVELTFDGMLLSGWRKNRRARKIIRAYLREHPPEGKNGKTADDDPVLIPFALARTLHEALVAQPSKNRRPLGRALKKWTELREKWDRSHDAHGEVLRLGQQVYTQYDVDTVGSPYYGRHFLRHKEFYRWVGNDLLGRPLLASVTGQHRKAVYWSDWRYLFKYVPPPPALRRLPAPPIPKPIRNASPSMMRKKSKKKRRRLSLSIS